MSSILSHSQQWHSQNCTDSDVWNSSQKHNPNLTVYWVSTLENVPGLEKCKKL